MDELKLSLRPDSLGKIVIDYLQCKYDEYCEKNDKDKSEIQSSLSVAKMYIAAKENNIQLHAVFDMSANVEAVSKILETFSWTSLARFLEDHPRYVEALKVLNLPVVALGVKEFLKWLVKEHCGCKVKISFSELETIVENRDIKLRAVVIGGTSKADATKMLEKLLG